MHTSNDYHKKWRGAVFALLIPPRYSSQGLFLISQTIRNDGALSFIVCAKKTKIYTARNKGERSIARRHHEELSRLNSLCRFRIASPDNNNNYDNNI